jgi:hypothetical protein
MDRAVEPPALELVVDRRAARRHTAVDLPSTQPIACRITPGHDVRVLNISAVGLLVESIEPLFPGRTAAVHLSQGERRLAMNGRIVRSSLAAIDRLRGGATFVSGIAFERRIDAIGELMVMAADESARAEDDRV